MVSNDVLYGLSRKWWDFYIKYTENTPPESPPQMSLFLTNHALDSNRKLEWRIRFDENSEADYVILDSEQWMEFCRWYNGGPVLKPKYIRGLDFQCDGVIVRFNGQLDYSSFKHFSEPFHLREGGGIRCREILRKLYESSAGEIVPMKVCTDGIWPDDIANALPNVCDFEYEESIDDVKKGSAGGGRRRRRREMEAGKESFGGADLASGTENLGDTDLSAVMENFGDEDLAAGMENFGGLDLPVGIKNLGATCYMNASFQFLLRPLTRAHYHRVRMFAESSPEAVLLREFVEVWRLLLENNYENPIELTDKLIPTLRRQWAEKTGGGTVFNERRREDSQEFLQFIFEKVLDKYFKEMCRETFSFMESQILKCNICQNKISNDDIYWMLGIPFRSDLDDDDNNNTQPKDFTLEKLLKERNEENKIHGRNCSECQIGRDMVNFSRLYSTSEYLIMYLVRAILNENRLNHRVEVPKVVDLRDFFREDRVDQRTQYQYKLCGVMDHLEGRVGHFIATVAQETETGSFKWFRFNDDRVATVTDVSVNSHTVYMLMYKRL